MDAGIIILIVVGLFIYFIPTIVGWETKYANGILVLNLFLGWTVLGWVGALVWAVSAPKGLKYQNYNKINNRGLTDWVSGIKSMFFTPSEKYQQSDSTVNLLSKELNQGEAIVKDKLTNEFKIVTVEQWSDIISSNDQDRFEIIEEK